MAPREDRPSRGGGASTARCWPRGPSARPPGDAPPASSRLSLRAAPRRVVTSPCRCGGRDFLPTPRKPEGTPFPPEEKGVSGGGWAARVAGGAGRAAPRCGRGPAAGSRGCGWRPGSGGARGRMGPEGRPEGGTRLPGADGCAQVGLRPAGAAGGWAGRPPPALLELKGTPRLLSRGDPRGGLGTSTGAAGPESGFVLRGKDAAGREPRLQTPRARLPLIG